VQYRIVSIVFPHGHIVPSLIVTKYISELLSDIDFDL